MTAIPESHTAPLRIPSDHPALPGHFPGQPVVPGVVILDHVLVQAERWLGRPVRVQSLQQAKFTAPLLPDQTAQVELKLSGAELRFAVRRTEPSGASGSTDAGTSIATGTMRLAAESAV